MVNIAKYFLFQNNKLEELIIDPIIRDSAFYIVGKHISDLKVLVVAYLVYKSCTAYIIVVL